MKLILLINFLQHNKKMIAEKEENNTIIKINNENYIFQKVLGKGTYGEVVKVLHEKTKEAAAIKKIKLDVESEGIPATTLREIAILKNCDHPNIVKLFHCECSDKKIQLLMEYLEYDLKKYWDLLYKKNNAKPDLEKIRGIMYQIFKAVEYLHAQKIVHRDLKPMNILINENEEIKIADFGLSRTYTIPIKKYTKEVLTLWYRSHELILGGDYYSIGIDMWSLGCIFGELLLGQPLFKGESEINQLLKIHEILGSPDEESLRGYKTFINYSETLPYFATGKLESLMAQKSNADTHAMDLLKKLLLYDPSKRINSKDAMKHPFFNGLNNNK